MLKLVFTGALLPGFEHDQVVDNLAQLLKQSPASIRARMFAGRQVVIKHVSDHAAAERWRQTFARAGAVLNVVPEESAAGAEAGQAPARSGGAPRPISEDRRDRKASQPPLDESSVPEYSATKRDTPPATPSKQERLGRRRGPLLAALSLLLVLGIFAAVLWYARPLWQSHDLTADQRSLMDALAGDDVYALGHVNVEGLLALEQLAGGDTDLSTLPGTGADFWSSLEQAGINPREQVGHVWLGAYAGGDALLVLTGDFQPAQFSRWLKQRYIVENETEEGVLFTWLDPRNCEKREPIMAAIGHNLILLGSPERIAAFRGRLARKADAALDLATWRRLVDRQLASVAVLVPENLGDVGGFAGMMLHGLGQAAAPANGFYLGLERTLMPPGVRLSAHLASDDEQFLDVAYRAVEQNLAESRQQVAKEWPDVAELYDRLSVRRESGTVSAMLRVDRDLPDQLGNLIASRMSTAFGWAGGLGGMFSDGEPAEERIEENPPQFADLQDAELPHYGDGTTLSSRQQPQAIAGPFAVNTQELKATDDGRVSATLEIKAVNLPNLGKAGSAITAKVTKLTNTAGASLIPELECGDMALSAPAEINTVMTGTSYSGDKQVFSTTVYGNKHLLLPKGVDASEVARVEGVIDYQMPVRVERVALQTPLAGQVIEKHGVRLRFLPAGENSVSYQVSGRKEALLHIRALNAGGQPLASQSRFATGMMFGSGRSINVDYRGVIASIEVILASELQAKSFRFTLDQLQPSVPEPIIEMPTLEFKPLDASQWQALQQARAPEVEFEYQQPEQTLVVGPALLAVTRLSFDPNFGLGMNGEVYFGNQLPLIGYLGNGELILRRLTSTGGDRQLDYRAPFSLKTVGGFWSNGEYRPDKKRPWLEGAFQVRDRELKVTDARSLSGELVIYGPTGTETATTPFKMGEVWSDNGLQLTVEEWRGNRVLLTFSGDLSRLVSLSALNAEGELASERASLTSTFDSNRIALELTDQPAQLQLKLATEMRRHSYPFELKVTQ